MLHRSVIYPAIALILLLFIFTAGLVYSSWSSVVETEIALSVRWLMLLSFVLASHTLVGYFIWWLLRQRQRTLSQTEVLHSIIHEFQTPITAIRMSADILNSPIAYNQPDRTEKYVRIIQEETERLQQQVESMLTLARADRNTLMLNREAIPLHQLLHSIAERHGNYLTLSLSGAEPYVLADRLHLTNVLYNLLDNAIKYSEHEPEITIRTTNGADGLTIAVQDRGVGISPKSIAQIFQPFFRVHDRNQPSVKGFGLGLSYVQRIVQSHDWTIWVKSEEGKGSEFMIQVPPSSLLQPELRTLGLTFVV